VDLELVDGMSLGTLERLVKVLLGEQAMQQQEHLEEVEVLELLGLRDQRLEDLPLVLAGMVALEYLRRLLDLL
jgi:hypothetical protein